MSNDCRTKCRSCDHYVDLVAGACPLCDEVYYEVDEDEVVDKKINISISFAAPTEGEWMTICKELQDLIPQRMTTERFNFLYMLQPVADEDKF